MFINSADELFSPITIIRHTGFPPQQIPWMAFRFDPKDWERVNDVCLIISDMNSLQQYFSHENKLSLWHVIPAFEELQMAWESKSSTQKFKPYETAINHSREEISKYYNKFDDKPVYILSLGTWVFYSISYHVLINILTVVHPYYKLAYIKMAWGGPEEQAHEREAGNLNAKDWYDKAHKVVERAMASYWRDPAAPQTPFTNFMESSSAATEGSGLDGTATRTLESEFDQHHRLLIQQSSEYYNSSGWAAELHWYLSDLPVDVTKDTDIVQWWNVHCHPSI